MQRKRAAHGAVAADRHQRLDAGDLELAQRFLLHLGLGEIREARGSQEGAAALDDAAHVARAELAYVAAHQTLVGAPDAVCAQVERERRAHHRAHRGIHARGVAAGGQHSNRLDAHVACAPM